MATSFESGLAALDSAIQWLDEHPSEDRNEASTRFHIIDRVVADVLGWAPEHITVERHLDRNYTDYELGERYPSLLIEAKREGAAFELPEGFSQATAKLSTLISMSPDLSDAIRQALGYAQQRSIGLAMVTNGVQYVGFLASRADGVPSLEGQGLVFRSIADVRTRFRDFWDAFSPPAVASRAATRLLRAEAVAPPPEKLSARIPQYPGYKNRNPIAAELQFLGGLFLEDIVRLPEIEPEFLRECYSPSGALPQYALVSREILTTRYSLYFDQQGEVTSQSIDKKEGGRTELQREMVAASLSKRPILLVGDVGVGKTMFLRHFIQVDGVDILNDSLVLYVDFGSQPALASDLKAYVVREFKRQLYSEYGIDIEDRSFVRSVYHGEIQRFERSIEGSLRDSDPEEYRRREVERLLRLVANEEAHLKASISHLLKAQRRQTVVFLDNVDQRPRGFQEEVFLIGQSMAATWEMPVFLSLRPETFYASKATGSLSGYQPRVFTISPPRVDRVLIRRLDFARDQLDRTGRLPWFPTGVSFQSDKLMAFLRVLHNAFAADGPIPAFVDNMSAGNIRRALEFVSAFVGSGHIDSQKILDIEQSRGYTLPIHEFLRAVIFGDHEHYQPSDSPICNVFDVSESDPREHFCLPITVAYVQRNRQGGSDGGYVAADSIYAFCLNLGYRASQVDFSLARCIEKNLLEAHPRPDPGLQTEELSQRRITHLRITTAGAYAVKRLMAMFTYLDAMCVDTPITDPSVRERVLDVRSIEERLGRTEYFLGYLDRCWRDLAGDDVLPFDWVPLGSSIREEIGSIRARLKPPQSFL